MNATMMTVNPFGENMYILWDETSHEAVVVDPGMMRQDERDMVTKFIADNDLKVKHILLTHLHLDHVTKIGCWRICMAMSFDKDKKKDEILLK